MREKEKKSKTLRLRLTQAYLDRLRGFAEKHNLTMTDVLTRYIQRLPRS